MKTPKPIKRTEFRPRYRKSMSREDRDFLGFVKRLPCSLCYREVYEFFQNEPWAFLEILETIDQSKQKTPTEAAHLGLSTSRRGLSQKFPARESGPLCEGHHTGFKTSHHASTKNFWQTHGIERDWIIGLVQKIYEASK